jgi:hypothetical protein
MDRHGRQAKLAGVGAAGQERIGDAEVEVSLGGLAAVVAAKYLAGAGVRRLRVGCPGAAEAALAVDPAVDVQVDGTLDGRAGSDAPSPFGLGDRGADEVARGAHAALVALRRALGMTA